MMDTRSNGRTHNWFGVVGLLIALLLMGSCSYSEEKAIEQSAVSFAQNTLTCTIAKHYQNVHPNQKNGCVLRHRT